MEGDRPLSLSDFNTVIGSTAIIGVFGSFLFLFSLVVLGVTPDYQPKDHEDLARFVQWTINAAASTMLVCTIVTVICIGIAELEDRWKRKSAAA